MNHNYGSAKEVPETFVERGNVTQFRYNVRQVTKETEQGTETLYKYDYVEVEEVTYKNLVDAMIRAKYDVNDEFNVRSKPATDPDFVAFIDYVEAVKGYAGRGIQGQGYQEPVVSDYVNERLAETIDDYKVAQLDALYLIIEADITGYHDMLKADKLKALKEELGI